MMGGRDVIFEASGSWETGNEGWSQGEYVRANSGHARTGSWYLVPWVQLGVRRLWPTYTGVPIIIKRGDVVVCGVWVKVTGADAATYDVEASVGDSDGRAGERSITLITDGEYHFYRFRVMITRDLTVGTRTLQLLFRKDGNYANLSPASLYMDDWEVEVLR